MEQRVEHDLLGERAVPADVYWGIHTLRARENFPITQQTIGHAPDLVVALAQIKRACANANRELGLLDAERADAIEVACVEIAEGALHDQFVVDLVQGGAGTSTNMNANEVIANRALELLGRRRGDYAHLHPNEHVNLSQSTNDVYPTAVRLALIAGGDRLRPVVRTLADAFAAKAVEFADVHKVGRTQLQDAVPMTLGQELGAYNATLLEDVERIAEATALLHEINLGATAIGTGITTPPGYASSVCRHLTAITGRPLATASDLIEATQDAGAFVQLSSVLKRLATKLSKICNDLRLLSSGPMTGLGEIRLPAMQAGSSIMPGKVNPVIPEAVNEIAFVVIGNDITVTMAAEAGQLQLNPFEPIMFRALHESLGLLTSACTLLRERCVCGIEADRDVLRRRAEAPIGLATALNPHIGYEAASAVVRDALLTGRTVAELVLERGLLGREQLATILGADVA